MSLPERFWSLVVPTTAGCWLWTGFKAAGYGRFSFKGTNSAAAAHRLSYEALIGEIPAGLDLDHLCRVPSCVNPLHLEPVTRRENIGRGGQAIAAAGHLTDRQRQILAFIGAYVSDHGYPPTVREIGAQFGIASTNGVSDHLKALRKKGYLAGESWRSRGLRVVTDGGPDWRRWVATADAFGFFDDDERAAG